jgi:peptidase S41-like protein
MFSSMRIWSIFLLASPIFTSAALAEDIPPETRREIVAQISKRFASDFYEPAAALPYLDRLRQLEEEALTAEADANTYALWLHRALQDVRTDGHLGIYGPERTASILGQSYFEGEHLEEGHHGSYLSTWSPQSDVLVLQLEEFAAEESDLEAMLAALAAAPAETTLIFDLRGNRGGNSRLFRRIAGCLFESVEPLFAIAWRDEDGLRIDEHEAAPNPTCEHLSTAPIYVLVDNETASTAELMPFILQARNRATVVGEATYGASHAAEFFRLPADFGMMLPIGRTYDLATGLDWEGTGVIPDIPSAPEYALAVALAHKMHRQRLAETGP